MRNFSELIKSTEYDAFKNCRTERSVREVFDRLDRSREVRAYRTPSFRDEVYMMVGDERMYTRPVCTDITVGHDRFNNSVVLRLVGIESEYYYFDRMDNEWYPDYSDIEWKGWEERR